METRSRQYPGSSLISLVAVAGILASAPSYANSQVKKQIAMMPQGVPGELIVKLRDAGAGLHTQAAIMSTLQKKLGQNEILSINPFVTDSSLQLVRIKSDSKVDSAIHALETEPAVKFAERNFRVHTLDVADESVDGAPNDPDFDKLWGMKNTGQTDKAGQVGTPGADINVIPAWKMGYHGSRNVVVAVIDTGVLWDHPDLKDNIYTNPGEAGDKAANGIDDDKNGFVDDVHGWNFADSDAKGGKGHNNISIDDHNHGTHVSGTIGGMGNNGVGIAGVNWEVSILPVKFLSAEGSGSLQGAIEAINYARMMKVNVMSNSWGGGGFSQALMDAIKATQDAGIVFVAAAGNEKNNNDGGPTYPAGYQLDNIIAVAATDNKDQIASFSNWGLKTVHVAAPGVKVYSSVVKPEDGSSNQYDTFSGTSMATPHVSGIVALMLSVNPSLTYSQVRDRLIKTSDPISSLRRKVVAHGRVNAFNAIQNIVPPSDEPDPSLWKSVKKVVESTHPYKDNVDQTFAIKHAGAKYIRVHFEKVDVENGYDKVIIETDKGEVVDELTGTITDATSEYIKGDNLVVRIKADESNSGYGFKIDRVEFVQ